MRFTPQDFDAAEEALLPPSEKVRRFHENWLNWALAQEQAGRAFPTIPTRAVHEGGFRRLMSTRRGRLWARQWWENALSLADGEF